jgi:hypothetical protein
MGDGWREGASRVKSTYVDQSIERSTCFGRVAMGDGDKKGERERERR